MAIITTSGFPADTLGVAGDYAIDPVAHFFYGPKTSSWSGTASSLQGPSGPGMVYGNGAPTNNQGAIGQGYLDLSSGNFYGPKASNGAWGSAVYKLQGAPGATGNNGTSVLTGSGAPTVTGVAGQVYIDTNTYNIYVYNNGAWGSPTALLAPSPTLSTVSSTYGPAAQFAGQTVGTGNTPAFFAGTSINHQFVPTANTALTGLTVSNYSASGATIYFYLYNLTDGAIVYNYNSGNGVANNTTATVSFAPVTLTAGKTYQWAAQRVTAAATTMQINPIYQTPSQNGTAVSTYSTNFVHATSIALSTNGVLMQPAGFTSAQADRGYYRNALNSYLYSIDYVLTGTGSASFVLSDGSVVIYTSPTVTASANGTRGTFGPFSVNTAYLTASRQCYWYTQGSGGNVTANLIMSVCQ